MAGGRIKAIDRESVHRIHSGQVVLDLQGALKELLENAFDAGSTSVDVRIKDHGLDTIEVSDNGSGIDEADWPSIALKHHTSKLPSLEELAQVSTFGFRGEALSALCALSESVTVVTATKETAPMGAVIKLGRDGSVLDDTGRVARQRGTTVTISGLFRPLPVRRKEFERTAKREYTKALGILTAYALVPAAAIPGEDKRGVRLKVEAIGSGRGGKRNVVLATDGRGALKSSVSAVWGPKALEGVVELNLELDVDVDKAMARREGIEQSSQTVRLVGLMSSAAWGQGRSSADRQYTYINGRPCTLSKLVKAVNEVYKSFNTNQVPLAILDFQIPRESVDINVSPDKRTIFVHSEANLIEALKSSLEQFFQPTRSSYAVGGASHTIKVLQNGEADGEGEGEDGKEPEVSDETLADSEPQPSRVPDLIGSDTEESQPQPSRVPALVVSESEGEEEVSPAPVSRVSTRASSSRSRRQPSPPLPPPRLAQQTLDTTVASWSPKRKTPTTGGAVVTIRAPSTGRTSQANLRNRLVGYASQSGAAVPVASDDSDEDAAAEGEEEPELDEPESSPEPATEPPAPGQSESASVNGEEETLPSRRHSRKRERGNDDDDDDREEVTGMDSAADMAVDDHPTVASPVPSEGAQTLNGENEDESLEETLKEPLGTPQPVSLQAASMATSRSLSPDLAREATHVADVDTTPQDAGYRDEIRSAGPTGEATLRFDMDRLRNRYNARRRQREANPTSSRSAFNTLREGAVTKAAGVANRDAEAAEEALSRVISKADFERMKVLGQFNKGFIIARLRGHDDDSGRITPSDDLFIVDQHASDEKFNFETLQRTTVIKAQALIRPRPMQLTAADEIVAMENLDVLHANGFDVDIDEDAAPGRGERVSLKAMPVSKETVFDFRDLEQLLHLLSDSARPAGQMVRCTKARAMFAMRACRRSVMIGKSLTRSQMVSLLRNMGTIDQPWNCPHGRPTMRHLTSLARPSRSRAGLDRIDWASVKL